MIGPDSALLRRCARAAWLVAISGTAAALAGCPPPAPATRCDDNQPCPAGYACAPVRHFCYPLDGSAVEPQPDAARDAAGHRDRLATGDGHAPDRPDVDGAIGNDGAIGSDGGGSDGGGSDGGSSDGGGSDAWSASSWSAVGGSDFGPATDFLTWGSAGGGGISNNPGVSWQLDLAIDSTGRPVAVWCDSASSGTHLYARRFDGTTWVELGTGSASGNGLSRADDLCFAPSLVSGAASQLYVAWAGGSSFDSAIYVLRFDGTAWRELGTGSATGNGISQAGAEASTPSIALDPDGTPVVAWSAGLLGLHEIYLKRFDGSAWVELGTGSSSGGGLSQNAGHSSQPQLAIDAAGNRVVAWIDNTPGNPEVYVKRFDGAAWVEAGTGSASAGGISLTAARSNSPALALDPTGAPVVVWQEYAPGQDEIYVRRFNGDAWVELGAGSAVGGGISQSATLSLNPALVLDATGKVLVAWQELAAGGAEILVRRFDGTAWGEAGAGSAGSGGVSRNAGESQWPALASDARTGPLVAWVDNTSGNQEIYARRFDGTSWQALGAVNASGDGISRSRHPSVAPALAIDLFARPVVVWQDGPLTAPAVFVRRHDGTAWAELPAGSASGSGISSAASVFGALALALDADAVPTVVWQALVAGGGRVYALRFDGSAWREIGTGSASGNGVSQDASSAREPSVVLDLDGRPIVAWQNATTNSEEIYVRRVDGTAWVELGTDSASRDGISANRSNNSVQPAIALGGDGQPIVAWRDDSSGSERIYVRRFDGTAWVELGSGSASGIGLSSVASPLAAPVIAIGAGAQPIVAWTSGGDVDTDIHVRRFDGASWVELGSGSASGGGISNTPGRSDRPALVIDAAGQPIVAWQDDSPGNAEIYLRRFDGAAWVEVGQRSARGGGISNSSAGSLEPAIACTADRVCVAWSEANQTSTEIVLRCAPLP